MKKKETKRNKQNKGKQTKIKGNNRKQMRTNENKKENKRKQKQREKKKAAITPSILHLYVVFFIEGMAITSTANQKEGKNKNSITITQ